MANFSSISEKEVGSISLGRELAHPFLLSMEPIMEESASLKPHSRARDLDVYRFQNDPQLRLQILRLPSWAYVCWVNLLVTAAFIPVYEWAFIGEPACWSGRFPHIMMSVFFALLTSIIGVLLLIANSFIRVSISYLRLYFCTICFISLTILSIANFLAGVYLFSTTTCYFDHLLPVERVRQLWDAQSNATVPDKIVAWLEFMIIKYDLKIVGMFHLLACLCAFATAMAFAIIKNNFKYIRQIDFE